VEKGKRSEDKSSMFFEFNSGIYTWAGFDVYFKIALRVQGFLTLGDCQ